MKRILTFGGLALVLGLTGCVVVPAHHGYVGAAPMAVVDVAPPPPYQEVVPVMPFAGAVWIGGYWGWSGGRHHWVPGYWERPRAGYRYEPHRWENRGGHWNLHGGAWIRL